MKKIKIFGNWKMYLDLSDSVKLAKKIASLKYKNLEVAVFPSALAFAEAKKILGGAKISVGAQNINWAPQGAYTGAVSAFMYKRAGAKFALVGHSERRYIFGEKDADVRQKTEACLASGLIPVLCVGETKEDLRDGKREYRLKKQLLSVFENLNLKSEMVIAYEPVWSISGGSGSEPCKPTRAEETMAWIKKEMKNYLSKEISVLYGGSVSEDNVVSYLSLPSCDGVLVGAVSTRADKFSRLIKSAEKSSNS